MTDPIRDYLKRIEKELQSGNTTEHSHRPHLKDLIQSFDKTILAINEPKRVKCGAPDYIVVKGQTPLGYIEAKDVGVILAKEEKSEQITRYRSSLSNLILTDYLEFRWYVSGEHRLTAKIAEISHNKVKADGDGITKFIEMVNSFLNVQVPTVGNSKELAQRMAALARLVRETIQKALSDEDKGGTLRHQMEGFREVLLHDMTEEQFADMYAQSICYGLFAARCNSDSSARFTREHAAHDLPKTNPFLKKMFSYIAGPDLDDRVDWVVDDLTELLYHCDMASILQDFGKQTLREDPVVHFYETFLSAYDPKMREMRGVYYTPEPVVSYIVRSVDHILKKDFGLNGGLADASKITIKTSSEKQETQFHRVQILDPACGTGTFLHKVVAQIYETFMRNQGMWSGYVSEHLLPRLWGFELLMAPYAVAHMKLGLQLRQSGYDFKADERLRIYLTNTLQDFISNEEAREFSAKLSYFTKWIADEVNAADKVKSEIPVMVILGNPPYSGHSSNKGAWIEKLLRGEDTLTNTLTHNYFTIDGMPLGEKNPKWLNDDYVKFIRFGQWRIEKTGSGVLGLVTNHSYVDSPTFRGMREALMTVFDKIYILDLHGSVKKHEIPPNGLENENVFDIQQGVAISIFVKTSLNKVPANVYHADMWGSRKAKHEILSREDVSSTSWAQIKPISPFYLFVPMKMDFLEEYNSAWSLMDAMPVNVLGFQTHRDKFAIAFEEAEMKNRLKELRDPRTSDEQLREHYKLKDTRDWKLDFQRHKIQRDKEWEFPLTNCLYRPFDWRYCYLSYVTMDCPRRELVDHVIKKTNICLLSSRQQSTLGYRHSWVCNFPPESCVVSLQSREQNQVFILYLYPKFGTEYARQEAIDRISKGAKTQGELSIQRGSSEENRITNLIEKLFPEKYYPRFPNFHPDFITDIQTRLNLLFIPDGVGNLQSTFGPEDAFHYIYAILNSPIYRDRYSEFLKIDFPRIPLTSNLELFRSLCYLGKELVELHLLKNDGAMITNYPVQGDHLVDKVRYTAPGQEDDKGKVWINKTQYFKGVTPEVWEFHVGGYQVCEKWLKDRKGRKLSFKDLTHYQRIVSALSETIRIMKEIDTVIEKHGGFPLK